MMRMMLCQSSFLNNSDSFLFHIQFNFQPKSDLSPVGVRPESNPDTSRSPVGVLSDSGQTQVGILGFFGNFFSFFHL